MADELAEKGGDFSHSDVEEEEEESEDEDDMSAAEREAYRLRKLNEREDEMYADYLQRTGEDKKIAKRKRRGAAEEDDLNAFVPDLSRDINEEDEKASDGDAEDEEDEEEQATDADTSGPKAGLSSRWFSQPIFNQLQLLNGNKKSLPAEAGGEAAFGR